MEEIFKPIQGFQGYFISNYGRVKSAKRKNEVILTLQKSRLGFVIVMIYQGDRLVTLYVSRLVLEAFKGYPTDPWLCVAHNKDGDLSNNRLDNLEWLICSTNEEYDPEKSHKKGVLRPDETKARMTAAKFRQSRDTIEKAIISRRKTVEIRNMLKLKKKLDDGKRGKA